MCRAEDQSHRHVISTAVVSLATSNKHIQSILKWKPTHNFKIRAEAQLGNFLLSFNYLHFIPFRPINLIRSVRWGGGLAANRKRTLWEIGRRWYGADSAHQTKPLLTSSTRISLCLKFLIITSTTAVLYTSSYIPPLTNPVLQSLVWVDVPRLLEKPPV